MRVLKLEGRADAVQLESATLLTNKDVNVILQWNAEGVLSPVNEKNPTGFDRSPYEVTLEQIIDRLATTPERCDILAGYLGHRAELHKMGMNIGFQWLDGSFTEDIEMLEHRPPRDLDVVTFSRTEADFYETLDSRQLDLLGADRENLKKEFKIDFYMQSLSDPVEFLVTMTTYWYGMWSHRRTGQWKGFLKVDLASSQDVHARNILLARQQDIAHEQV